MRIWLSRLLFFDDRDPHSAPMNMARDEALLVTAELPVLRLYRWARPAVSFGYFDPWQPVVSAHPGREPVRRWTGGGIVLHGEDLTYSLLIPAGAGVPAISATTSYRMIHGALCEALQGAGIPAWLTADSSPAEGSHTEALGRRDEESSPTNAPPAGPRACFENPVRHDIMLDGRKIAGAAQRRTRCGLLHQGSLRIASISPDLPRAFAAGLARVVEDANPDPAGRAASLAASRYATREWLEKY